MMHVLVSGVLANDPVQRTSAKGSTYITFSIRLTDTYVSCLGFESSVVQEVMSLRKGDAIGVTGRGELKSWVGRDNVQHHGVSVTVDRVLTLSEKSKTATKSRPKLEPELEPPVEPLKPWPKGTTAATIPNDSPF